MEDRRSNPSKEWNVLGIRNLGYMENIVRVDTYNRAAERERGIIERHRRREKVEDRVRMQEGWLGE